MNHVDPKSLKTHPAAAAIPDLPPAQYAALKASIERKGILQPLLVDDAGRVIDGRHRLRAAVELGLEAVPVASIDGADAALIACEAAVARRNLTASGRVLILFTAHPDLQRGGADRRKGNLKRGASRPDVNSVTSGESKEFATFEALADRYGVPRQYFSVLAEIRAEADAEEWAVAVRSILENEASIPAVRAGLAGRRPTAGSKRTAPDYGHIAPKAITTLTNTFKGWSRIKWIRNEHRDMHREVVESFGAAMAIAPPEIRATVTRAVLAWPEHERADLLKELRAAGKRSGAFGG